MSDDRGMRILITAGPTREPIDSVRYIGNRSSGAMGAAMVSAAIAGGHLPTLIAGPLTIAIPNGVRRIDVQTAAEMHAAVMREFPNHDLLIMAAAVADYRPVSAAAGKIDRAGKLIIECEATPDIVADAARGRRKDQRIVGFSLESGENIQRAREKIERKQLDLIVYNPIETMNSLMIRPILIRRDGREESLPEQPKEAFAEILISRAVALFEGSN
jgi:phosphopantothenoylcysteine decarboxylase/phosphopantothenate--cysteine ligase